jgi:hypothetical protein
VGKGDVSNAASTRAVPVPTEFRPHHALASVLAPAAGLFAAWIAARSVGLIGHPLSHALTLISLGIVVIAAWPGNWIGWPRFAAWIGGILAAVVMTASSLEPINVAAAAVLLAAAALCRPDAVRSLRSAAVAVAVLSVYRLALESIPAIWLATDHLGNSLGIVAGSITGEKLSVGATFAGLDFLVTMLALLAVCCLERPRPNWRFVAWSIAGILVAQLVYLIVLSESPRLLELMTPSKVASSPAMPEAAPPIKPQETFQDWAAKCAKDLVPWNVPILAALLQAAVAGAMFNRLRRRSANSLSSPEAVNGVEFDRPSLVLTAAAGALAALLPVVTVLAPFDATLERKKIVAYEYGLVNWLKPEHDGQYGQAMIGMYGTFGRFVESFGGTFTRTKELSDSDLKDADLLVLFYPTASLDDDQLRRVQNYVEKGGQLLLLCDHTDAQPPQKPGWILSTAERRRFEVEPSDEERFHLGGSRFNDILQPTAIRVADDAAEFAVGGWLESYEPIAHPTTVGLSDHTNIYGCVIGASLDIGLPAAPVLVGRWGYSDAGDRGNWQSMLGNSQYDPGEKLGDLVLAAVEPWGEGRVFVFGDTSSVTNRITTSSYPFVSRLLAHLVGGRETNQAPSRQALGEFLAAALVFVLLFRPSIQRPAIAALVLSVSLAICVHTTFAATEMLPDGRTIPISDMPAPASLATGGTANSSGVEKKVNGLAYIDMCHFGSFSDELIRPDSLFGFHHALMREGYQIYSLYDLTYERLSRAGLFASIGPQRAFTAAEREAIRQFVEQGGIFILMAGYDRVSASRELLADFGMKVGALPLGVPPDTEPAPLGHFKASYFKVPNEYEVFVRFHAAWPVGFDNKAPTKVIASGIARPTFDPVAGTYHFDSGSEELPVIVVRDVGRGKVVLIGDTDFATNKNLENEKGTPIEGLFENADFWRWFIPQLRGTTPWLPPKPEPKAAPAETAPGISPAGTIPPVAAPESPGMPAIPPLPQSIDGATKANGQQPPLPQELSNNAPAGTPPQEKNKEKP